MNCLDISNSCDKESVESYVNRIRSDIEESTGCPCSAGIASNLLLAKLAIEKAKPNGQYLVKKEDVNEFLSNVPVRSLPGVGEVIAEQLHQNSVFKVSDLLNLSKVG